MSEANPLSDVSVFTITQATAATFTDLYFQYTLLLFVRVGSKKVLCPINGELIGNADDVIVFPPGAIVTLENRPVLNAGYQAVGICFPHQMIKAIFADQQSRTKPVGIQILQNISDQALDILDKVQTILNDQNLPQPIREHRLLEPLIWLKYHGIHLSPQEEEEPLMRVRKLIQTNLSHPWRSPEIAAHFSISESTMRRWLSKSGLGFAKTLHNTRLEHGLALLQTTDTPISAIALNCGFNTPSHFSDSFKQRFGIKPSEIRKVED